MVEKPVPGRLHRNLRVHAVAGGLFRWRHINPYTNAHHATHGRDSHRHTSPDAGSPPWDAYHGAGAPTPTATLVVTPPPVSPGPTATPTTPTPTPTPAVPQPRGLLLDISSPGADVVVNSRQITIAGRASPDATVSVNGVKATLDGMGRFDTMYQLPPDEGPTLIEVIASDLAGDVHSSLHTVIYTVQQEGLFGKVSGVAAGPQGLVVISLDTSQAGLPTGPVTVEASAEDTAVIIPGAERGSAGDLSPGDFLAVLGRRIDGNRLAASRILVKPDGPVVHIHLTGFVAGVNGDWIRIMDRFGNLVTTDLQPEVRGLSPAQVVTAILGQDLRTGRIAILGADPAAAQIARLSSALQAASPESRRNLEGRLAADITGHLTTAQEYLHRADPELRSVFNAILQGHQRLLEGHGLGAPTVRLDGVLQDLNMTTGRALVAPRDGIAVQLNFTPDTAFQRFGELARIENLEARQGIEAIYDPQTGDVETVNVVFPSITDDRVPSLLGQVPAGELQGRVSRVDLSAVPPVLVVELDSGRELTLGVTPDTKIRIGDQSAQLGGLVRFTPVKVRYNPSSLEALFVDTFDTGQTFLSGVVRSFVPKIRPGVRLPGSTRDGNISITTPEGETISLHITDDSVIERDGLMMNISAIKLGDLVRPTSRYDPVTREVQKLDLRAPELRGTIRGKGTSAGGRDFVTISTERFDLVTVTISPTTEVVRDRGPSSFASLDVGEGVLSASTVPSVWRPCGWWWVRSRPSVPQAQ